jgi:hypothetical protein
MVGLKNDVPAPPSIAAAGTALGTEGFTKEGYTTFAAVTGAAIYFDFIDIHSKEESIRFEAVSIKKARWLNLAAKV